MSVTIGPAASGMTHIVAGSRPWSRAAFDASLRGLPGRWTFVAEPTALNNAVAERPPTFIWFLHWSWKVPAAITGAHECVAFHMTDLPYGRGGSPLQNLILRRHRSTKLSAFRMTDELDAGPVYLKEDLSLEGTAEDVYQRANLRAADMIQRILELRPQPVPQSGDVVLFSRRTVEHSRLPAGASLAEIYDFIRMLDAPGYPHAFVDHSNLRFEFTRAAVNDDAVVANVRITSKPERS